MKRLAVCLIGQIRGFTDTHKFILSEFGLGDDVQVDYFCHTWDSTSNFSPWNNGAGLENLTNNTKRSVQEIHDELSLINPVNISISSYEELFDLYGDYYLDNTKLEKFDFKAWEKFDDKKSLMTFKNFVFFYTLAGQFFSSAKAINMALDHQKENNFIYDGIVRWRYDLAVDHRPEEVRRDFWLNNEDNTVYVNNIGLLNNWVAVADHWFSASGDTMKYLRDIDKDYTKAISQCLTRDKLFINEYILYEIFRGYKLSVKRKPFKVVPFRTGANTEMTWDQINEIAQNFEAEKRKR